MADVDNTILQDDLRDLLRALGMSDAARAQSPHEVFRECISAVEQLRASARRLISAMDAMHCAGETFTARVSITASELRQRVYG